LAVAGDDIAATLEIATEEGRVADFNIERVDLGRRAGGGSTAGRASVRPWICEEGSGGGWQEDSDDFLSPAGRVEASME